MQYSLHCPRIKIAQSDQKSRQGIQGIILIEDWSEGYESKLHCLSRKSKNESRIQRRKVVIIRIRVFPISRNLNADYYSLSCRQYYLREDGKQEYSSKEAHQEKVLGPSA
jgi:hypothetical protein